MTHLRWSVRFVLAGVIAFTAWQQSRHEYVIATTSSDSAQIQPKPASPSEL